MTAATGTTAPARDESYLDVVRRLASAQKKAARGAPAYSIRAAFAGLRNDASNPEVFPSEIPNSASNRVASSDDSRYARYRKPRPRSPVAPKPNSRQVVGMISVSTNGRSTPLNDGGSCRSLTIPIGVSSIPPRRLKRGLMRKSR